MAKIKSPLRFSRHFGVPPAEMHKLGVFDPVLQADTKLFIDPVLLRQSAAPELKIAATDKLKTFFENLYRLLAFSRRKGDIAWTAAVARLKFHEVSGTCLGYGGGSIHGSGWGEGLTGELMLRAKELIDLGVDDPELFLLIGLFSENVGPDRISDMTTNIILGSLGDYTARMCCGLGVPIEPFVISGAEFELPVNPLQLRQRTPVILVPTDVLRELPVAFSVEDIWVAARESEEIRNRINQEVGVIWRGISKERKSDVLRALLKDPEYAKTLIRKVLAAPAKEYDQGKDPRGLTVWSDLAYLLAQDNPHTIAKPADSSVGSLNAVVVAIIEQFRFLIEKRDTWRVLHEAPTRKTEKTAQMLFFAVAYSYCQANNLDVTPEADTGNGPVDFKFSSGGSPKILVELKLSKNDVQRGHDVQLPDYVDAEKADGAHYVVVNVGSLGKKWMSLQASRTAKGQAEPQVWLVDATPRASASVRTAPRARR
ncbi:hypothetical protein [Ideonella sp. YS5]|uniref:hypothetical protein n=1 Tax=Ideonella sp. YS5 TaxID=3453714 RepID=UPI003EEE8358